MGKFTEIIIKKVNNRERWRDKDSNNKEDPDFLLKCRLNLEINSSFFFLRGEGM